MTGRGISISIPVLMLGPYLRPLLYWTIGISAAMGVLLLCIAGFIRGSDIKDQLVVAAGYWFVFSLTAGALTLFLHFMGMP